MGAILVTGGAGYIGSHICRALRERGRGHVVLDDLSAGHAAAVKGSPLEVGGLEDCEAIASLLRRHRVEWIIHMAARSLVGESMNDPGAYWKANVESSRVLLAAARAEGVRGMVFSSTAAVYGEPERVPMDEEHPCNPTSVYGETKLAVERDLDRSRAEWAFASISLRYFNAAGAAMDETLGEDHAVETHLIPLALGAALGTRPALTIHGTDYPTPDGTGIRDYIHVEDLAEAHLLAIEALETERITQAALNLGAGNGRSVRDVLEIAQRIARRPIPALEGPRRPGDPAVLVASSKRAEDLLGWRATRSSLPKIVESAWRWHREHPRGFAD